MLYLVMPYLKLFLIKPLAYLDTEFSFPLIIVR
jgi:hypothetical protein